MRIVYGSMPFLPQAQPITATSNIHYNAPFWYHFVHELHTFSLYRVQCMDSFNRVDVLCPLLCVVYVIHFWIYSCYLTANPNTHTNTKRQWRRRRSSIIFQGNMRCTACTHTHTQSIVQYFFRPYTLHNHSRSVARFTLCDVITLLKMAKHANEETELVAYVYSAVAATVVLIVYVVLCPFVCVLRFCSLCVPFG